MDAAEIYQAHLDATSHAMWIGDRATLAALIGAPHAVTVNGETRVFRSVDEVIDGAAAFRASMVRLGATAYHRVAISAAFETDERQTIQGRHRVYILHGGSYIIDPYETEMTLVHDDDHWRCGDIAMTLSPEALAVVRPLACVPPNPTSRTPEHRSNS
ncbi:MAG: hypothetical protein AAF390_17950 [Pseudomonadota bacterium]